MLDFLWYFSNPLIFFPLGRRDLVLPGLDTQPGSAPLTFPAPKGSLGLGLGTAGQPL